MFINIYLTTVGNDSVVSNIKVHHPAAKNSLVAIAKPLMIRPFDGMSTTNKIYLHIR